MPKHKATRMDIYERIEKDHDRHRELATKLAETSGDSQERRDLWRELKGEVESHAAAEEQTFYAALIEKPDGQEKARHSIHEHEQASDLIEELEDDDMSSPGWIRTFEKLKESLEHHMDEEEAEVFPLARRLIDDSRASQLAKDFDERKAKETQEA